MCGLMAIDRQPARVASDAFANIVRASQNDEFLITGFSIRRVLKLCRMSHPQPYKIKVHFENMRVFGNF